MCRAHVHVCAHARTYVEVHGDMRQVLQAVELDASAVPGLQVTVHIVNTWCDGQRGQEYQVHLFLGWKLQSHGDLPR